MPSLEVSEQAFSWWFQFATLDGFTGTEVGKAAKAKNRDMGPSTAANPDFAVSFSSYSTSCLNLKNV